MPLGASALLWGCALLVVECRPLHLHALPRSGSRWESGTSQIPASPEGCHVALWRAAEGGAYHGHAAFALFWGQKSLFSWKKKKKAFFQR